MFKKLAETATMMGFSVVIKKIVKIENIAERIGSLFGNFGKEVGRKIDSITRKIVVHID